MSSKVVCTDIIKDVEIPQDMNFPSGENFQLNLKSS